MGFFKGIDYWKFAEKEDIVSNDIYPDVSQKDLDDRFRRGCDLMRSPGEPTNHGFSWSSPCPCELEAAQRGQAPRCHEDRQHSSGRKRELNGIMIFQWRASKAGAEKTSQRHGAARAGAGSRTWNEVKSLGNELKKLDCLTGSRLDAVTAILLDWDNCKALELDSKPSNDLRLISSISPFTDIFLKIINWGFRRFRIRPVQI
jgi:beta-galactosidase